MPVQIVAIDFAYAIVRSGGAVQCTIYVKAPAEADTTLTITGESYGDLITTAFPFQLTLPQGATGVVCRLQTANNKRGRVALTVSCDDSAHTHSFRFANIANFITLFPTRSVLPTHPESLGIPITLIATGPSQQPDGATVTVNGNNSQAVLIVAINDTAEVTLALDTYAAPVTATGISVTLYGYILDNNGSVITDDSIIPQAVTAGLPTEIAAGSLAAAPFPVYLKAGLDPTVIYQVAISAATFGENSNTLPEIVIQFQDAAFFAVAPLFPGPFAP